MDKRVNPLNSYPIPNSQYHSYGLRHWDGENWNYWGSKYSKKRGHVEQWLDSDFRCWTTTSILSAMFKSQDLSIKNKIGIEVVQFEEPKVVWHAWYENRRLELEEK